jgi:hypothetical protein
VDDKNDLMKLCMDLKAQLELKDISLADKKKKMYYR